MIEKTIVAALEPLADAIIALDKRFNDLKLPDAVQGEPGKDADPVEIANLLKNDADFLKNLQQSFDVNESLDIKPDHLAKVIEENKSFFELLRGEPGAGINAPLYAPGIYREGAVITANIGQYFRALKDTIATPGDSEDWERIGCAGFRWRKLKPDEETLKQGDLYIDGGSLFLFDNGRASMLVQRGKSGHSILSLSVKDNELICDMDSNKQFKADLSPLVIALGEITKSQLVKLAATLDDFSLRLAILESKIEFLDNALFPNTTEGAQ